MNRRIQDILVQNASDHFVGRRREVELLRHSLDADGPIVQYIYGIGGIGKSSLLLRYADDVRKSGIPVIALDCREVEPSVKGFLLALEREIGCRLQTPGDAGQRLGALGARVVLVLDGYEVFRLMDSWLRQEFIPQLTENLRIVIAGREPPVSAWLTGPGWERLFQSMSLEPLDSQEARDLLRSFGLPENAIEQVNLGARGHPLALKLAAAALCGRPDLQLKELNNQAIIPHLVRLYLEDVPDRVTREALEAVSVVRRATQSLLGILMPESAPQDAYERLASLPFVVRGRDGLVIHETVRQVIADNLLAADPSRYRWYRFLAYRQYRKELKTLVAEDIWRYTADLLYLMEEPFIREAFFPTDSQRYAVESARACDHEAILAITEKHETATAVSLTERLLQDVADGFRVVRSDGGRVVGYYIAFDPLTHDEGKFQYDPVMKNWWRHLAENPLPPGQRALFMRRWLGEEQGELPSPVQAACWIDIKGDYLRMRSVLRRVYCGAVATDVYGPVMQRLGFEILARAAVDIDGVRYQSAVLDFGAELMLGWLDGHVRASLNLGDELLDYEARELILQEKRVGLTPLEFGVMAFLCDHEGKAISRSTLLDKVWGLNYEGGSNVVDARVRELRKKLGAMASTIETVSGVGYRFRAPAEEALQRGETH